MVKYTKKCQNYILQKKYHNSWFAHKLHTHPEKRRKGVITDEKEILSLPL